MIQKKRRSILLEEKEIILKLLDLNFAGSTELRKQLVDLTVEPIDKNGSLNLWVAHPEISPIRDGLAAEAQYPDLDATDENQVYVHVLLHVRDGLLWYLEIYKDGATAILKKPDPKDFQLFTQRPKL